jgi:hypothetical protein
MSIPEVVSAEKDWPVKYCIVNLALTDLEGVAGLSGLLAKEKEKEKTPGEMEIKDVARPSGNPAMNTVLAIELVKVEEEENTNRVQYEILEVTPSELVIEDAPATMVEGRKVVVEPKPETVKSVILPVIVLSTKKECKKLRITTRKIKEKEVIEILNLENELPVEGGGNEEDGDGKKLDAQTGDGKVLAS